MRTDISNLPNFVPIFTGFREHVKQGISPTEVGVYVMLHMVCDYKTGTWTGTSAELSGTFGSQVYLKSIQKALFKLRKMGYVNYRQGRGSKGSYKIAIDKYIVRHGTLKGYTVNAFYSNDLWEVSYDLRGAGGAEEGRSWDGGRTVEGRSGDAGETQAGPNQELKKYKNVIVVEINRSKTPKRSGVGLGREQQTPPAGDPQESGAEERDFDSYSTDVDLFPDDALSDDGANQDPDFEDDSVRTDSEPCEESDETMTTLLTPEEGTRKLTLKIYHLLGYGEPPAAELAKESARLLPKVREGSYRQLNRMIAFAFGRPEENPFWINLFRERYTQLPVLGFLNQFDTIEEQCDKHQTIQARASLPRLPQVQRSQGNSRNSPPRPELTQGIKNLLDKMKESAR